VAVDSSTSTRFFLSADRRPLRIVTTKLSATSAAVVALATERKVPMLTLSRLIVATELTCGSARACTAIDDGTGEVLPLLST
jgi:hypothetical protein